MDEIKSTTILDKAISLLDAVFTKKQGNLHYSLHKNEFPGLTKQQYLSQAQQVTETKQGKKEIQYVRKDKSRVRYNLNTKVMTIWYPVNNTIATHFKPKFNNKTKVVNKEASYEYIRNDMKSNGITPNF